jgi:hypothetical protein
MFEEAFAGYIEKLEENLAAYYEGKFTHVGTPEVTVELGRKYARVVVGDSVHTFVNKENGDILKAASFRAPAKNGVRGSIFAEDFGMSCVGPYGALYITGGGNYTFS